MQFTLMQQTMYHMQQLQHAFCYALLRQQPAPGLAGFRVLPEHVQAACARCFEDIPHIRRAAGYLYAVHCEELYLCYAAAMSRDSRDCAVERVITEFSLDPVAMAAELKLPLANALDACVYDDEAICQILKASPSVADTAFDTLWQAGRYETAVRVLQEHTVQLPVERVLDLADQAVKEGSPTAAWGFMEAASTQKEGTQLRLALAAVKEDRTSILSYQPVEAFMLLWEAGLFQYAMQLYEEYDLNERLSTAEKVGFCVQAAGLSEFAVFQDILEMETDAHMAMLQYAVLAHQETFLQHYLCVLQGDTCACAALKHMLEAAGDYQLMAKLGI